MQRPHTPVLLSFCPSSDMATDPSTCLRCHCRLVALQQSRGHAPKRLWGTEILAVLMVMWLEQEVSIRCVLLWRSPTCPDLHRQQGVLSWLLIWMRNLVLYVVAN